MIPLGIVSSTGSSLVPIVSKLLVNVSGTFYSDTSGYSPYSLNYGPSIASNNNYTPQVYDIYYIAPQTITVTLTGIPESGPGESQPLSDKPLIITKSINGTFAPPQTLTTNSSGQVTFSHPSYWGEPQDGYLWSATTNILFEGEGGGDPATFALSQSFFGYDNGGGT
jgi:hypothetical protein